MKSFSKWVLTVVATLTFTGFFNAHAAQAQEPKASFGLVCKTKDALLELYAVANRDGEKGATRIFKEKKQCVIGGFLMMRDRVPLGIVALNGNVLDIEEVLVFGWIDEAGNLYSFEKPVIRFATFKNGKESI